MFTKKNQRGSISLGIKMKRINYLVLILILSALLSLFSCSGSVATNEEKVHSDFVNIAYWSSSEKQEFDSSLSQALLNTTLDFSGETSHPKDGYTLIKNGNSELLRGKIFGEEIYNEEYSTDSYLAFEERYKNFPVKVKASNGDLISLLVDGTFILVKRGVEDTNFPQVELYTKFLDLREEGTNVRYKFVYDARVLREESGCFTLFLHQFSIDDNDIEIEVDSPSSLVNENFCDQDRINYIRNIYSSLYPELVENGFVSGDTNRKSRSINQDYPYLIGSLEDGRVSMRGIALENPSWDPYSSYSVEVLEITKEENSATLHFNALVKKIVDDREQDIELISWTVDEDDSTLLKSVNFAGREMSVKPFNKEFLTVK